ncbi:MULTISPECIES: GntR family transcriptional regulator [unclassified Polynucleobacter]|uniref:GntR family transcriptional regulator n=1 Tax=unclassified Polynucleobacter TaxID=2640945 RepID=UPI0025730CBF|nr:MULTISPECIES: GntR family transcriptional regulator [unclassified Polynucleobacter]BEI42809.1 GntR family transcriptional regulator [Polynucleobacter sp. HIN10]BEI44563.1 GntR family transcriptional regulator [Polynucleobacter sp. HIN11]
MRSVEQSASFSPLYQQIKDLLLQSLQAGEWQPGHPIPSEMDLAERYKVSQGTVRKAIDALAAENVVVRHQGKGTFVASHREDAVQFRFLRLAPDDGKELILKSTFLSCESRKVDTHIASLLELKPSDSVIEVKRIQRFGGQPTVFETIYLLPKRFEGISLERLSAWHGPLYGFYESEFNTHMVWAQEQIKAVNASAELAKHLDLDPGEALLSVERRSFTYGNKPVEVRMAYYETTKLHYVNELS